MILFMQGLFIHRCNGNTPRDDEMEANDKTFHNYINPYRIHAPVSVLWCCTVLYCTPWVVRLGHPDLAASNRDPGFYSCGGKNIAIQTIVLVIFCRMHAVGMRYWHGELLYLPVPLKLPFGWEMHRTVPWCGKHLQP